MKKNWYAYSHGESCFPRSSKPLTFDRVQTERPCATFSGPGEWSAPAFHWARKKPPTFCIRCWPHTHTHTSCCPTIWAMNHSQSFWINYSSKPKTKWFANCPGRRGEGGKEVDGRKRHCANLTIGSVNTPFILNKQQQKTQRKKIATSKLIG